MLESEIQRLLEAAVRMFIAAGFDAASVDVAGRTVFFDRRGKPRGETLSRDGALTHLYVFVEREKLAREYQPGQKPVYRKYQAVVGVDETSMAFQLAVLEAIPELHEKLKYEAKRVDVAREKLFEIAQELLERYDSPKSLK